MTRRWRVARKEPMNWNNMNRYEITLTVAAGILLAFAIAALNVTASVIAIGVLMAVALGFVRE
jgi:hypothetical protein